MTKKRHFILLTVGTYGDVLPFIALAESLIKKGHKVSFFANPYFKSLIKKNTFDFYPLGTQAEFLKSMLINLRLFSRTAECLKQSILPKIDLINDFILKLKNNQREDTVIICNTLTIYIAYHVKELNPWIKLIQAHFSPFSFYSLDYFQILNADQSHKNLTWEEKENVWNLHVNKTLSILPDINEARGNLNLPVIKNLHQYVTQKEGMHLALFPEWFTKKLSDLPSQLIYTDFILSGIKNSKKLDSALESFISSGEAPILVSQPSFQEKYLPTKDSYLFKLLNLLAKKYSYRFILIGSDLDDVTPNHPSILRTDYLPFEIILPIVKAFVHHGGAGTIAQALKSGVPQFIIPSGVDQFTNAKCIEELGVGLSIDYIRLNEENFVACLGKLCSDKKIQKQCIKIARKFNTALSPDEIVDKLIDNL